MKKSYLFALLLSGMTSICFAAGTIVKLEGTTAQQIYKAMKGPAVENQGAAGHIFRQGKSILCAYTTADITGSDGKNLSQDDPKRFACVMQFNANGYAKPGKHF